VIGQTILHYEVKELLGTGGTGEVYKALDQKLNRLVALKFLAPGIVTSAGTRERFMQEATALSVLNHPHIATLFDIHEVEKRAFLVLEYLAGGTVKARLEGLARGGERLSIEELLEYGKQAGEGLAHAHRRGIIHRDIKTSNLMLTEERQLKITDFGVAKLSRFTGNTTPGILIGTLRYMSPEQAEGKETDARSDLFSFGVVLFELTTGRVPFEAETRDALLAKIAAVQAPALSAFRADVPARLERIVATLMMKKPSARYQNADDLVLDLRSLQITLREHTETSQATSSSKLSRRRRVSAAAAVILLLPALVYFYHRASDWARTSAVPAAGRVAVLPFDYVGNSPSDEAFNAGLFEILTGKLDQFGLGRLNVVSANEVLEQKINSPSEARKLLGATLALTGIVRESEGRLSVSLALVDAASQVTLESRKIEATREELATIPARLLEQAAEMLKMPDAAKARVAPGARFGLTQVPEALELYLRGRGYLQRYDRLESVEKAIEAFDKALSLDSTFALAHAGRAESYLRRYQSSKDMRFLAEARESSRRAIELNRQLFDVHLIMGLIQNTAGEYPDAIISFESGLKIQPESADALRELANTYVAAGRPDEAEATFKRLIRLRPDDWSAYKDLGIFYNRRGRIEEALSNFKRVVDLTPDNYVGYRSVGGLYLKLKDYKNAESALQKSLSLQPTDAAYSNLATLYYLQGRYVEASDNYRKTIERNATNGIYWGNLGDAYRWIPGRESDSREAYRQAIALFERELAVNPLDEVARANCAMYWSHLGENERALAELRSAIKLKPDDGLVLSRASIVYEQAGMRDRALGAVEGAIKGGFRNEMENWPPLESLRRDPRYRELIDRCCEVAPQSH
jgi:serine/threonine-protein kinase